MTFKTAKDLIKTDFSVLSDERLQKYKVNIIDAWRYARGDYGYNNDFFVYVEEVKAFVPFPPVRYLVRQPSEGAGVIYHPAPRDKGRKPYMQIIKIRRGIPGRAKYCACYEDGTPLKGFDRLGDARKHWNRSIKAGKVQLVRELDKHPNMEIISKNIKMLEAILQSMAK